MNWHGKILIMMMAALSVVLSGAQAQAQLTNPRASLNLQRFITNRPTVSPYLHLLESDNQFNIQPLYQSRVRPEIEFREQQLMQQRQIDVLQQQQQQVMTTVRQGAVSPAGSRMVRPTGHPTRYMNYLHYYPPNLRR